MRFALIDLFALTLLICLMTAVIKVRQASSDTAANLAKLQPDTSRAADDCQEKKREIELFTRTIKRRGTDLGR